MDFSQMFKVFTLVFFAELGDKTQLAILSSTAGSKSPVSVLAGSVLALALTSLLAVLLGGVINKIINPRYFEVGAGVLFIIMGVLYIVGK